MQKKLINHKGIKDLNFDIPQTTTFIFAKNGSGKTSLCDFLEGEYKGVTKFSIIDQLKKGEDVQKIIASWDRLIQSYCEEWAKKTDNSRLLENIKNEIAIISSNPHFLGKINKEEDSSLFTFFKSLEKIKNTDFWDKFVAIVNKKDSLFYDHLQKLFMFFFNNNSKEKYDLVDFKLLQEKFYSIANEYEEGNKDLIESIEKEKKSLSEVSTFPEKTRAYKKQKLEMNIDRDEKEIENNNSKLWNELLTYIVREFGVPQTINNTYNAYSYQNSAITFDSTILNFLSRFCDFNDKKQKNECLIFVMTNLSFFEAVYYISKQDSNVEKFWLQIQEIINLKEKKILKDLENITKKINDTDTHTLYTEIQQKLKNLFFDYISITSSSMIDTVILGQNFFRKAEIISRNEKVDYSLSDGEYNTLLWIDLYIKAKTVNNKTFLIDDSSITFDEKIKMGIIKLIIDIANTDNIFVIFTHDMWLFNEIHLISKKQNLSKEINFKILEKNEKENTMCSFTKNLYESLREPLNIKNAGLKILFCRDVQNKYPFLLGNTEVDIDDLIYKNGNPDKLFELLKLNRNSNTDDPLCTAEDFHCLADISVENFSLMERIFWEILKIIIIKAQIISHCSRLHNVPNKNLNITKLLELDTVKKLLGRKKIARILDIIEILPLISHPSEFNINYYANLDINTLLNIKNFFAEIYKSLITI